MRTTKEWKLSSEGTENVKILGFSLKKIQKFLTSVTRSDCGYNDPLSPGDD